MKIYPEGGVITVVLGDGTEVTMSAHVIGNLHSLAIYLRGGYLCAQVYGARHRRKTLTDPGEAVLYITKREVTA